MKGQIEKGAPGCVFAIIGGAIVIGAFLGMALGNWIVASWLG